MPFAAIDMTASAISGGTLPTSALPAIPAAGSGPAKAAHPAHPSATHDKMSRNVSSQIRAGNVRKERYCQARAGEHGSKIMIALGGGAGNGVNAAIASGHICLHAAHSLVQAATNKVGHRFMIFTRSSIARAAPTLQAAMAVR